MSELKTDNLLARTNSVSIFNKIHIEAITDLLIEKGIFSREEFIEKVEAITADSLDQYNAEILGVTVEELQEWINKEK